MKRKIIIVSLLLACLLSPIANTHAQSPAQSPLVIPPGTPIYLMIGQSNMSGRSDSYPSPQPYDSLAFVFGDDYRWCVAQEPMDRKCSGTKYVDAINWDSTAEFGPELDFAIRLRELNPSEAVAIIPCSRGGSYIEDWLPSRSDNSLLGACFKRAHAALSTIDGGYVGGVMVAQGEQDAGVEERAYAWRDNFEIIVNYIRAEFGSDIPVVIAQIGTYAGTASKPYWSVVQDQELLASQTIPSTVMFTTTDLGLDADGVHKDKPGYRNMGRRFAIKLCTIKICQ